MTFYNEFDANAAQWLRNLGEAGEISQGVVDERSIKELSGADLSGVRRAHFFAGIGGWDLALRLAGWPEDREVWTGSCPCQPFSSAGKGGGVDDERHLWPEFFRLIKERHPATIFGEQVGSKAGIGWLDGVQADLEGEGYTCGAVIVGAHSVGAPHIRQRIYWVATLEGFGHADGAQDDAERGLDQPGRNPLERGVKALSERKASHDGPRGSGEIDGVDFGASSGHAGRGQDDIRQANSRRAREGGRQESIVGQSIGGLADDDDEGQQKQGRRQQDGFAESRPNGASGRMEHDIGSRECGRESGSEGGSETGGEKEMGADIRETVGRAGPWSDYRIIPCTDGKARRTGSRVFPLAYGLPRSMGALGPKSRGLAEMAGLSQPSIRQASRSRIGMLKGSGNAIVPELAALFISAYMETL